ncbi:MAG: DUF1643 domain-containing protein [Tannerellaceae bacterium]|jgi:hypothetical protein|nr:DUF1643 domain-containing protein [Tannerellaceae bacterium]
MEYKIDIYKNSDDNRLRYALGIKGNNPLVVLALNPSTADEKKPDRTIRKVMGIADGAKKDGFIVINLYPLRATSPNDLPIEFNNEYHQTNLETIDAILKDYEEIDVLVAFGSNIGMRSYLKDCLKDIVEIIGKHKTNWRKTGPLTKYGHPRHPLYVRYAEGLTPFNMEEYTTKRI